MHPEPHFAQGSFVLRRAAASDVAELRAFHARNQEHFRSTGPRMPGDAGTHAFWASAWHRQTKTSKATDVQPYTYFTNGASLGRST